MKKLLLFVAFNIILIVGLSGCTNNSLAITPKSATFDTSSFSPKQDKQIKYWVDTIDNQTIIIMNSIEFYNLIADYKNLKADYNLLLDSINNFNKDLKDIK